MKNHFLKLFFFRRFCFSPKRKSGKIPVVLLSLVLLAACQPTPETEVVMNKGDGTFAIITKRGVVITYFKPKDGYDYYKAQIERARK